MAESSKNSVLGWYDGLRPMFIDLVGDYAGRELFLVDGDSLLRHCVEDDRIDLLGNIFHFTANLYDLALFPLASSSPTV